MGSFKEKKRLGKILVDSGLITEGQLSYALEEQRKTKGKKLGETLIDMGYVSEIEIAKALQEQLKMELVKLSERRISQDIIHLITNQAILDKYVLMPFEFKKNECKVLRVAMADPMDIIAIDDLGILTGYQIEPVIATPFDIKATIDKYYGTAQNQIMADNYAKQQEQKQQGADEQEDPTYRMEIESSPIVKLVRNIIEQAVRQRASDIHIEALEHIVRVRYRIDGVLSDASTYQASLLPAILARIKIIAGMDISERRKPQDGRITMDVDRKEFDIRVSTLPTSYGEKVVMRLSEKRSLNRAKLDLGLTKEDLVKFDKLLANPHGLILVTGPTGSGKSTTLYTALSDLNRKDVNIITVEDPVEANIDGINQVQVNPKAELTFASALRSILRQDPDIIMIGEIRDTETAQIAVKASITGHLVVSTLHTNSAANSITRLIDMGLEPYLLGDATIGVIAQRLIRKLCSCKKRYHASVEDKAYLKVEQEKDVILYAPTGCNICNDTGYYGRIGVYEIMPITAKLRSIINRRGTSDELLKAALGEGMTSLQMSVIHNVLSGITSIGEMKRIALEEGE